MHSTPEHTSKTALKEVAEGGELSDEAVKRLATMINRKLLNTQIKESSKGGIPLWSKRWDTLKGDVLTGKRNGDNMQKSSTNNNLSKTSSWRKGKSLEELMSGVEESFGHGLPVERQSQSTKVKSLCATKASPNYNRASRSTAAKIDKLFAVSNLKVNKKVQLKKASNIRTEQMYNDALFSASGLIAEKSRNLTKAIGMRKISKSQLFEATKRLLYEVGSSVNNGLTLGESLLLIKTSMEAPHINEFSALPECAEWFNELTKLSHTYFGLDSPTGSETFGANAYDTRYHKPDTVILSVRSKVIPTLNKLSSSIDKTSPLIKATVKYSEIKAKLLLENLAISKLSNEVLTMKNSLNLVLGG